MMIMICMLLVVLYLFTGIFGGIAYFLTAKEMLECKKNLVKILLHFILIPSLTIVFWPLFLIILFSYRSKK